VGGPVKYRARKAAGLCVQCGEPPESAGLCCNRCKVMRNERQNIRNAERRASGRCVTNGCHSVAVSGGLCGEHKAYHQAHRNKWRVRAADKLKDTRLRRLYGITLAAYNELLQKQNGGCAICRAKEGDGGRPLYVDHNHTTGEIRGLLCGGCNRGLGHFQDDADRLGAAIYYLLKTKRLRLIAG
jgi:hypothetical protein